MASTQDDQGKSNMMKIQQDYIAQRELDTVPLLDKAVGLTSLHNIFNTRSQWEMKLYK
jgi:hypothetical protein